MPVGPDTYTIRSASHTGAITDAECQVLSAGAVSLAPKVPNADWTSPGDFLLMSVSVNTATAQTFTVPDGWTPIFNASAGAPILATFWARATDDMINKTQTVSWQTSAACSAIIVPFMNVDWDYPIDDFTNAVTGTGTTTTQFGTLSMLPMANVVVAIAAQTSVSIPGNPVGYNQYASVGNLPGMVVSFEDTYTVQSTGAITSTGNTSAATKQACLIALRPAQGPRYRGAGTQISGSSVTSISPAQPADTVVGDGLFALVRSSLVTNTWQTPSGWFLASQHNGRALFYRAAAVAGSGTTHTFSLTGTATTLYAQIFAYANAATVDAITAFDYGENGNGDMIWMPPASLGTDRLLALFAVNSATGSVSQDPSGANQRSALNGLYLSDEAVPGPVDVGLRTIPETAAGRAWAVIIAPPSVRTKMAGASSWITTTAGTTFTINKPVGVTDGKVEVMLIGWGGATGTITPPGGWNEVESDLVNAPNLKAYWRRSLSEPTSYTWSWINSVRSGAVWLSVLGGAFDADAATFTSSGTASMWPSVTTTIDGDLLIYFSMWNGSETGATAAMPAGTHRLVHSNLTSITITADFGNQLSAGATSARAGVAGNASAAHQLYVMAISPNSAPTVSLVSPVDSAVLPPQGTITFDSTASDADSGDAVTAVALRRKKRP